MVQSLTDPSIQQVPDVTESLGTHGFPAPLTLPGGLDSTFRTDGMTEWRVVPDRPTGQSGELSLDTVLSPFVIVFCVAFLVAYLFTPIMRTIAVAYGIVDEPDKQRKIHRKPVAYLGGVAVFLGFIAGLAVCHRFSENPNPDLPAMAKLVKIPLAFIASACVIVALGLLDDLRGVKPILKILGQIAAAVCLLWFGIGSTLADQFVHYGFSWVHNHFGLQVPARIDLALFGTSFALQIEQTVALVTSAVLVVALVVFCCNASNLMDGLDGLCGGITSIIALGLIVLAAHLAMTGPVERAPEDAIRLVIAIALFGAVLGFLPYNFNPASIFMGDTGSLFMGFVIATSIILLGEAGGKWLLGALVMFSLPVLDTALAFARRYVNKRPFFAADKQHFHHQLVSRGLTIRRAVVLSYALTVFFVAAGALLVFLRTRYAVAFYLVLFGSIVVAAYKMGMIHERRPELDGEEDDDEELLEEPEAASASGEMAPAPALEGADDRRVPVPLAAAGAANGPRGVLVEAT